MSTKKRTNAGAPEAKEQKVKASKKEESKKQQEKEKPKMVPEEQEDEEEDVVVNTDAAAAEAEADEPAKKKKRGPPPGAAGGKKRNVVRFNPHKARDYLDLPRYWKHHESLQQGLNKAQAALEEAQDSGDAEKEEAASTSVVRYQRLLQRIESRRDDALAQLKVIADLFPHAGSAEPLLVKLVSAFADPPKSEAPEADGAAAAAGADEGAAPADADAPVPATASA